jgi:hypothetical protein
MSENSARVLPEIGTLWSDGNGESRFVGSASGVYFLRTVQNAFSNAAARSGSTALNDEAVSDSSPHSQWSAEHIFGSEERPASSSMNTESARNRPGNNQQYSSFFKSPHQLPPYGAAKHLTKLYFETWHSLAPFLHGPTLLKEMEEVFARGVSEQDQSQGHSATCWNIIFQCVWNLALLDAPELKPLDGLYDCSPEQLIPALGVAALQDSLISIQALLSAQLLFIATMSLRSASITGGLVVRAIMKAGLHRCPFRYPDISPSDRDMRKRTFWTAYMLDRFLSQALGQPLGIQDSDVDVCPPGSSDLHSPAWPSVQHPGDPAEDMRMHLPSSHPNRSVSGRHSRERHSTIDSSSVHVVSPIPEQAIQLKAPTTRLEENKSILSNSVASSRLLGRALEIFHKSIHVRSSSAQDILLLKIDIETWGNDSVYSWNSLHDPGGRGDNEESGAQISSFKSSVFSIIAHHQLLLFVNRPSLSAKESSTEFRLALQACISASRSILKTLRKYLDHGWHIFWPGHLLAIWMSGLVIAFACRVKAYDVYKSITFVTS